MPAPRLSTSDLVGPLLIFVGGFLLAAAVALPTLFVSTLRTIPLSTDVTTVAPSTTVGAGAASILDRCSLASPTARVVEAELTRQQRFVAVRPADSRRVTLQAGTSIRAESLIIDGHRVDPSTARPGSDAAVPAGGTACTDPTVTALRDRVTLNRSTAQPDLGNGGSSEVQYDSNSAPVRVPDRRGFTYVLPFNPPSTDQTFFDATTRRSVPLKYTGTTSVHGHDAMRFVAEVPDTDLAAIGNGTATSTPPVTLTRPASWFGAPGVDPARNLTADLHHSSRWEISVDPDTGIIVNERITILEQYRFVDTALPDHRITNLSATFAYDARTQRAQLRRADALGSPITVWGIVIPALAAVAGLAAVIAGLGFIYPDWRPWGRVPRLRRPGR